MSRTGTEDAINLDSAVLQWACVGADEEILKILRNATLVLSAPGG
jgi:hypothetical protein